jgi:galactokinase
MMKSSLRQSVQDAFLSRFGAGPKHVVRAPGRVNLIGEHTDYNDGFVLPLAIDRATWIALRPLNDEVVRLHSVEQNETAEFNLAKLEKAPRSWREYPKGVAWALREEGYELHGWEGISLSDVPIGAGLSSSASFELAVARAFAAVGSFSWDAKKMALLCQKAENQWVGVNCGIMDQLIVAIGKEDHAVLIDCRDLSSEAVPIPAGVSVVIMDTGTRRDLMDVGYNERRMECQAAATFFGVKALRDLRKADFDSRGARLDEVIRRRAWHVITENQRTRCAAKAMKTGDAGRLGQLINPSHESLRDDLEVSNSQLDIMVESARKTPGCLGARMTGGGFGGCAVALVENESAHLFIESVSQRYEKETGLNPRLYLCRATNGAECIF